MLRALCINNYCKTTEKIFHTLLEKTSFLKTFHKVLTNHVPWCNIILTNPTGLCRWHAHLVGFLHLRWKKYGYSKTVLINWRSDKVIEKEEIDYSRCSIRKGERVSFEQQLLSNNCHKIVENLLHCITILRNICAHGGRLYNRLFTRKPWLSKKEKSLLRVENGNIVYDKLFSYILVLKSITLPQDFKLVVEHITQIKEQYPLVDFRHYGFPVNWQEIL